MFFRPPQGALDLITFVCLMCSLVSFLKRTIPLSLPEDFSQCLTRSMDPRTSMPVCRSVQSLVSIESRLAILVLSKHFYKMDNRS